MRRQEKGCGIFRSKKQMRTSARQIRAPTEGTVVRVWMLPYHLVSVCRGWWGGAGLQQQRAPQILMRREKQCPRLKKMMAAPVAEAVDAFGPRNLLLSCPDLAAVGRRLPRHKATPLQPARRHRKRKPVGHEKEALEGEVGVTPAKIASDASPTSVTSTSTPKHTGGMLPQMRWR